MTVNLRQHIVGWWKRLHGPSCSDEAGAAAEEHRGPATVSTTSTPNATSQFGLLLEPLRLPPRGPASWAFQSAPVTNSIDESLPGRAACGLPRAPGLRQDRLRQRDSDAACSEEPGAKRPRRAEARSWIPKPGEQWLIVPPKRLASSLEEDPASAAQHSAKRLRSIGLGGGTLEELGLDLGPITPRGAVADFNDSASSMQHWCTA